MCVDVDHDTAGREALDAKVQLEHSAPRLHTARACGAALLEAMVLAKGEPQLVSMRHGAQRGAEARCHGEVAAIQVRKKPHSVYIPAKDTDGGALHLLAEITLVMSSS